MILYFGKKASTYAMHSADKQRVFTESHPHDDQLWQGAGSSITVVRSNTPRSTVPAPELQVSGRDGNVRDNATGRGYVIASYVFIILFAIIQLAIIFAQKTGPFYDEAIYSTAGLRSWQGKGLADGYLVWFAGSLLWPMLAGLGYHLYGLAGVRIIAFLLALATLYFSYLTTKELFGVKAACFTVLCFVLSGPFMALAHLGVYDSPALTFTACSFWCMTKLKGGHRFWLCLSAISLALAAISKYPIALMILPVLALLLTFRKRKALMDVSIFLFLFVAVFFAYFLPVQYQVGNWLFWSIRNKPTFGATLQTIIAAQLYLGLLPFIFALLGFCLAPRKKEALILLLAGLIWPLYHIASQNPVSDNKHVIFGFLFTYPLIGLFCATVWQKRWFVKPLVVLICMIFAVVGTVQLYILDMAWPDVRQPAAYLAAHAQPGDLFLIDDAWPYTLSLYGAHKTSDPWTVFDNYRISDHENKTSICDFDWYVDEKGSYEWSEQVRQQILACHTFVPVYHYTSSAIGLGTNLLYIQYPVTTTIYQNIKNVKL
jgi:4-amino-4-deoxy-L-arabinose transferase and related glycosyltransferases of PMT family